MHSPCPQHHRGKKWAAHGILRTLRWGRQTFLGVTLPYLFLLWNYSCWHIWSLANQTFLPACSHLGLFHPEQGVGIFRKELWNTSPRGNSLWLHDLVYVYPAVLQGSWKWNPSHAFNILLCPLFLPISVIHQIYSQQVCIKHRGTPWWFLILLNSPHPQWFRKQRGKGPIVVQHLLDARQWDYMHIIIFCKGWRNWHPKKLSHLLNVVYLQSRRK